MAMFIFSKLLYLPFVFWLLLHGNQRPVGTSERPFTVVLGIAQDAGYPQADCRKTCCQPAWEHPERRRMVACIAVVDPAAGQYWLVDAMKVFAGSWNFTS